MADLVSIAFPTTGSILPPAVCRVSGLLAGEPIAQGAMVYVKSDGLIYNCNGAAATAPAKCRGIALEGAALGEPVTVGRGLVMAYSSGLTPGADYYVSTTPGKLSTVATTGGTAPVAFAVSATKIYVTGSAY